MDSNICCHAYDNVAEDAVWRTVHDSLPALIAVVESEIANTNASASAARGGATPSPDIEGSPVS